MKKLMFVIHSLKGGGSERVAVNLLKSLDKTTFSIHLVLYERVFDLPLPENIKVTILDIYPGTNIQTLTAGFVRKIIHLARLMKNEKPDIVFSLLSSTNVTVIIAKLLSKVKCSVIISEHTLPSINLANEKYGTITAYLVNRLYSKADKIVAVSEGIRHDLMNSFHLSGEKIKTIYNPVDIKEIQELSVEEPEHPWFKERIPVIIAVGRLTRLKCYPCLLRAFSAVRSAHPCRLMIIGDGEERNALMKLARELGIEGDTEMIGFQKNPFKYMARSSVFVLSSLYEGFGNVIVEAMALGLAVVSTDCPTGPSEIVENGKDGVLVPVKDEKAMAGAILGVLADERFRRALGERAREKACRFHSDRIISRYREVFLEDTSSSL